MIYGAREKEREREKERKNDRGRKKENEFKGVKRDLRTG